jgi:hypothetical protein
MMQSNRNSLFVFFNLSFIDFYLKILNKLDINHDHYTTQIASSPLSCVSNENLSSKTSQTTSSSLSSVSNTTVSSTNSPNLTQLERTVPSLPLTNGPVSTNMVWSANSY